MRLREPNFGTRRGCCPAYHGPSVCRVVPTDKEGQVVMNGFSRDRAGTEEGLSFRQARWGRCHVALQRDVLSTRGLRRAWDVALRVDAAVAVWLWPCGLKRGCAALFHVRLVLCWVHLSLHGGCKAYVSHGTQSWRSLQACTH